MRIRSGTASRALCLMKPERRISRQSGRECPNKLDKCWLGGARIELMKKTFDAVVIGADSWDQSPAGTGLGK